MLLLFLAFPLALQYQTGSLEGTVASQQGPIAGASVEVRNIMTGAVFRVTTDVRGHYEVARLRPGRYSLWVETPDHDSVWVPRVLVERGQATHRDVPLGPPISSNLDSKQV
jgi:hypothetical protein